MNSNGIDISNKYEKNINHPLFIDSNYIIDYSTKEQKNPNIYYYQRKTAPNIYSKKYSNLITNQFNSTTPIFYSKINQNSPELYQNTVPITQTNYQNNFNSNSKISFLEQELKELKLNYITLNNDNLIFKEDINKLVNINKKLEEELTIERTHNYELAKENDLLNNESQNLVKKINEVNGKISKIKSISINEKELMNKQIFFEEKINEKEKQNNLIIEENNKLNLEYNLLSDKFKKLQEKNTLDEKELNNLKKINEEKLIDIEKKLEILINEMNNLRQENDELKKQNENYKINIINNEKEKNDFYHKYQEQKIKNEMINKENEEIQGKYREYKNKFEKQIEKNKTKEKTRKNKSENKIRVIQDLYSKIKKYKNERTRKIYNIKDEED